MLCKLLAVKEISPVPHRVYITASVLYMDLQIKYMDTKHQTNYT